MGSSRDSTLHEQLQVMSRSQRGQIIGVMEGGGPLPGDGGWDRFEKVEGSGPGVGQCGPARREGARRWGAPLWERGIRTPGRYYTPRLCLLFQLGPEQLGFRPGLRLASDCRKLSQALGRALAR